MSLTESMLRVQERGPWAGHPPAGRSSWCRGRGNGLLRQSYGCRGGCNFEQGLASPVRHLFLQIKVLLAHGRPSSFPSSAAALTYERRFEP